MDSVLFVCTGNICRSPFMEHYLRDRLAGVVSIGSAGVRAVVGQPMSAEMTLAASAVGVSAAGFRSRQLTRDMVANADLVITADRSHRAGVLELMPGVHRRLFTLRQAARLLTSPLPDPGPLSALAELIARRRGQHPASNDDDVPDPFGGPTPGYAEAVDLMMAPLDLLGAAILRSAG